MIGRSIISKLWLSMVVLMVTVLFLLAILLGSMFERFYFELEANRLISQGLYLGEVLVTRGEREAENAARILAEQSQATVIIADPSGLIKSGARGRMRRGMRLTPEEIAKVQAGELLVRRGSHPHFDVSMLSVVVPVQGDVEGQRAVLLHTPLKPFAQTADRLKNIIFLSGLGAVLLVTVLAFLLSLTISKPLLRINRAAAKMIEGDFNQRVSVNSRDEIGLLGHTLNVLAGRLKETMQNLSSQHNQLAGVLASMTDGVISFDDQGRLVMANDQAKQLMGRIDLKSGQHISECGVLNELNPLFVQVQKEGKSHHQKVIIDNHVLMVKMSPLSAEGENRGVVAVIQDVTSEHRLEEMRKEFVANVSHELRTPLFLLQGYGQALQEGMADTEAVEVIVDETRRMQRLVDDLLELTRLEPGVISLNKERIFIQDFLENCWRKFDPVARGKDLTLSYSSQEENLYVMADPDRLTQVMINLVDNAIRHTPPGGKITLKAERKTDKVKISVEDTGEGIKSEDLNAIWERFYRVDKARSRDAGGTGLGLSIVKRIIEAHGGQVFVESMIGQGTTFGFTLPLD